MDIWEETTPHELGTLLREKAERTRELQRRADLRAGLVAATIYNSKRTKKSDRVWRAEDFFQTEDDSHVVEPETMERIMVAWARAHNRGVNA